MSSHRASRSVLVCSKCLRDGNALRARTFASTPAFEEDVLEEPSTLPTSTPPPPSFVDSVPDGLTARQRTRLQYGSRRRRALLEQLGENAIPFYQLPYQCFQEARKVLQQDRQEKIEKIQLQRGRLEKLKAQTWQPQDEQLKQQKIFSMQKAINELKIHADINDPLVKKRFEDGQGDMSKPIYRHLADQKWREMKRKILMQRVQQMNVVPDLLPSIDPTVSTTITFRGSERFTHGEIVDSSVSEQPPHIEIQPYDRGERLVTIIVINPDVPNVAEDTFSLRCHFLASNISISPLATKIDLASLGADQVVQSWLPAYSQKGLPYQRLAVFVLEQPLSEEEAGGNRSLRLDVEKLKSSDRDASRDGFKLKSFMDRHHVKVVGVDLFRTIYDENTAGVMQRAGIPGSDIEFKRKRIDPLPYQRMSTKRYR